MARDMRGAAAALACLALGLAGCTADGPAGADPGPPRDGGTLRVIGSSDVEHLDTASVASVGGFGLTRLFSRTLLGIRASNEIGATMPVRADVAAKVPARGHGISADGLTYTLRLRPGVRWDTAPPREVTAGDFERGFKRLCNPASPSSSQAYFLPTLRGMAEYCRAFGRVSGRDPAAIAAFQRTHAIPGVHAVDDRTIVFRLIRPASDFLNLLTLQASAAAPAEYDRFLPDGPDFRRHTISDGPYRVADYRAGQSITLGRNPAWSAATDPLRERHVATIRITFGQDSPDVVQQQIEAGAADLAWDQPVPTSVLPRVRADPRFAIQRTPSNSPYVVFNTRSPNNGGALARVDVRRALSYAVDRSALVKLVGGPSVARPLHGVIPPGSSGFAPSDPYPTPGDAGNPAECRRRLAAAGRPHLTLVFPYRTNSVHRQIAESLAANLRACGVETKLRADSGGDFYRSTISDPAQAREGHWDIAAPGWTPDWYGNNGRSVLQPLLDGRLYGPNSTNYGGYDSPDVDRLIDRALTASSPESAARLWRLADRRVMADAPIIPLLDRSTTVFHASRVRNAQFLPTASSYDYSRLWLAG
ncbi:Heme-binding protein A precursor [Actinomadura rubteroloni]|uniref:Heme-binding protein A n=1 Tax=Actinomadura rubteroloni TaxID=1926885 RepID=A0A2P4UMP8_9ACTN|nr:ABC transporter substrate-binding protein [Actinomadura rubteroloni]POM26318.1 Heme-binding protein A precursor [Actinomadura rubteroloni]